VKRAPIILLLAICFSVTSSGVIRGEEDYQNDSAEGLPPDYAKNYLIARATMPPVEDGNFAVIYPTADFSRSKEAKDLLVTLKPFKVLAALPAEQPCSVDNNDCSLSADWRSDFSATLITFDTEWGARDVFLVELSGDKVTRITNLLEKTRELLRPKFRSAKPKPKAYNNADGFAFQVEEGGPCQFEEEALVRVYVKATNDPKFVLKRPWRVLVDAMWDIAKAKFVSQKIRNVAPGERDD
jgi:hypothetical protein